MRELYPYQRRALAKSITHPEGGALLMEPGLGKTITAIRAAQHVGAQAPVVVAPLSAVGVWRDELAAEGETVHVPEGTRSQKADHIDTVDEGWIVLNYEALLDKNVMRSLELFRPDLVIFDEAHRIKTATAKRSKAAHKLSQGRRTLLLTGTPVTKNLLDLYSMYKAIDPGIWDDITWTKFKQRYAIMGGFEMREVIGIRDQEDIQRRIEPYSVSARKEDVLDLPPKRHQIVPVYLGGSEWKDYARMAQHGVLEDKGWVTTNPLTKALRLAQITSEAKTPVTVERIEELLDADEKVVVFYRFLQDGRRIQAALSTKRVYPIRGATPPKLREDYVKNFQNIPGPAVLLGQLQATSEALTLTAASEVIYHSASFSYGEMTQSRDRVYRIGQERPVRYQYITAVGPNGGKTIDGLILDALEAKADFASVVMDDPTILETA